MPRPTNSWVALGRAGVSRCFLLGEECLKSRRRPADLKSDQILLNVKQSGCGVWVRGCFQRVRNVFAAPTVIRACCLDRCAECPDNNRLPGDASPAGARRPGPAVTFLLFPCTPFPKPRRPRRWTRQEVLADGSVESAVTCSRFLLKQDPCQGSGARVCDGEKALTWGVCRVPLRRVWNRGHNTRVRWLRLLGAGRASMAAKDLHYDGNRRFTLFLSERTAGRILTGPKQKGLCGSGDAGLAAASPLWNCLCRTRRLMEGMFGC